MFYCFAGFTLLWRHNGHDGVSNHQPHQCLLNRPPRRRSKKTSKLRVTCLCAGNSPETGKFPAQMASNAENVSIWWRHHEFVQSKVAACLEVFVVICWNKLLSFYFFSIFLSFFHIRSKCYAIYGILVTLYTVFVIHVTWTLAMKLWYMM